MLIGPSQLPPSRGASGEWILQPGSIGLASWLDDLLELTQFSGFPCLHPLRQEERRPVRVTVKHLMTCPRLGTGVAGSQVNQSVQPHD